MSKVSIILSSTKLFTSSIDQSIGSRKHQVTSLSKDKVVIIITSVDVIIIQGEVVRTD